MSTLKAIIRRMADVVKDFEPVSLISTVPELFVARSTLAANATPLAEGKQ
jgi:hypothetical protein